MTNDITTWNIKMEDWETFAWAKSSPKFLINKFLAKSYNLTEISTREDLRPIFDSLANRAILLIVSEHTPILLKADYHLFPIETRNELTKAVLSTIQFWMNNNNVYERTQSFSYSQGSTTINSDASASVVAADMIGKVAYAYVLSSRVKDYKVDPDLNIISPSTMFPDLDNKLATKADKATTYTKTESDAKVKELVASGNLNITPKEYDSFADFTANSVPGEIGFLNDELDPAKPDRSILLNQAGTVLEFKDWVETLNYINQADKILDDQIKLKADTTYVDNNIDNLEQAISQLNNWDIEKTYATGFPWVRTDKEIMTLSIPLTDFKTAPKIGDSLPIESADSADIVFPDITIKIAKDELSAQHSDYKNPGASNHSYIAFIGWIDGTDLKLKGTIMNGGRDDELPDPLLLKLIKIGKITAPIVSGTKKWVKVNDIFSEYSSSKEYAIISKTPSSVDSQTFKITQIEIGGSPVSITYVAIGTWGIGKLSDPLQKIGITSLDETSILVLQPDGTTITYAVDSLTYLAVLK